MKNVILKVHFFYGNFEEGERIELTGEEAKHARVLRLRPGERVGILDGMGRIRMGETILSEPQKTILNITGSQVFPRENPQIHLSVSLIKDRDRMEWLIEKMTELGVAEFTPLICNHTEKTSFNRDRWEKIITASFKQCGRPWRPVLNDSTPFDRFVRAGFEGWGIIGLQSGRPFSGLPESVQSRNIRIVIGPEGDFSENEIQLAKQYGFEAISFGNARYRTETAGLVATISVSLLDPQ